MKFDFQSTPDGSRSNSVTAVIHQISGKRRKKKTALSTVENGDEFILSRPDAPPIRQTKRSAFSSFFRGWTNGKLSNKARYKASRVVSQGDRRWLA